MLDWWESSQRIKGYINFSEIFTYLTPVTLKMNEIKVTKIYSALKLVLVVHLSKFRENSSYIQDFELENRVKVTKTKSIRLIVLKVYLCWTDGNQENGSRDISILVKFTHN